jgi:hypothetical protein
MKNKGGTRKGAGRKPRPLPKSTPIWAGQLTEQERDYILANLTPDERYQALLKAAQTKQGETK